MWPWKIPEALIGSTGMAKGTVATVFAGWTCHRRMILASVVFNASHLVQLVQEYRHVQLILEMIPHFGG